MKQVMFLGAQIMRTGHPIIYSEYGFEITDSLSYPERVKNGERIFLLISPIRATNETPFVCLVKRTSDGKSDRFYACHRRDLLKREIAEYEAGEIVGIFYLELSRYISLAHQLCIGAADEGCQYLQE